MNKVEINGIYYNLNECEKTAQVTEDPDEHRGAVSIPETVTYNGITYSVTSIGYRAFYECWGLESVNIPGSVTCIGYHAFYRCPRLTSIFIPNSITKIGQFAFDYCKRLADVYCYAEKVPSTESDAFEDSYIEYASLHVPAASIEQYKTTKPWSDFGTIVAIDDTETHASRPASKAWAAIIKAGMKVWAVIIKAGTKAINVLKK